MTLRLAIFDCDGTLVDSQHSIVAAMGNAFEAVALPSPSRAQCLSVVGLSLPYAMQRLLPDADEELRAELCEHYKRSFREMRSGGSLQEPLYPGVAALLDQLEAHGWQLAIATGKSDRGLRLLLEHHSMSQRFISLQTADRHPSKPHPSMIEAALADAGADRRSAVMIGDTSFDMLMAKAAGVRGLGVAWGYHDVSELIEAGADTVAMDTDELARHIGLQ
jgi:phosphoglycolate phosphatase